MAERLTFGTAGLRAPLGDGPLRMNVRVIEQVATAIAKWLPSGSTVVIGRDARHGSEDFANVTARVLLDNGHSPRMFADPVPTPVVAHEVLRSTAAAGVMVTASHNPATDNGYKVYANDGGQILGEDAAIIEATMGSLPLPDDVDTALPDSVELLGEAEVDAYLDTISTVSTRDADQPGIAIAYTALHGVGGDLFVRALEADGHRVVSVPEQHEPDPDFPTAAFPNPEEPGTLDLVMELADSEGVDLVLANDPDADRLAVAVRREAGWERLTGDEIGVLLGDQILGKALSSDVAGSVATTIVSSSLLAKIATASGVQCHTTLTGFKWLARAADDDDAPLLFAYEEALGYAVTPTLRDKDGISAGVAFAELVASLPHGATVDDVLRGIHRAYGVHVNSQRSVRFDGDNAMNKMTAVMASLRNDPPKTIGSLSVVSTTDLIDGTDGLEASDVLIYELDGGRVIIRPSGTEPKVKAYLEVVDRDRAIAVEHLGELERAAAALLG